MLAYLVGNSKSQVLVVMRCLHLAVLVTGLLKVVLTADILKHGSKVIRVKVNTPQQLKVLHAIAETSEYDFWTYPKPQGETDILVRTDQHDQLTRALEEAGIKWSIIINDVKRLMTEQKETNDLELLKSEGRMSWTAYQRYSTIVNWLDSIAAHELVSLSIIGHSFEGRDIHQVKISTGNTAEDEAKPAIFIDAHFHAREWITSAATTWIINEIILSPEKYTELLSTFDLFFVPLVNPDGYEFSHGTFDRFWRKTRSIVANSSCLGTDLNRNFGFQFGGENSSDDPCSDMFRGHYAFSESEAVAIRDAIKAIQTERMVHAYYSIHSYGQKWLVSWGYHENAFPEDFHQLLSWGQQSVAAIAGVHQSEYSSGQGARLLYPMGGASFDWAKNQGIKYVTTLEVRDTGTFAFLLPPNQIVPTAEEIWAGIQVIMLEKRSD